MNTLILSSQAVLSNPPTHENEILDGAQQKNRESFWAEQAENLHWFQPWNQVLDWKPPFAKWFINGKLNASYNCLDRHVQTDRAHKLALICEGERGEIKTLTYAELHNEVCRFSNVLKSQGVQKGDKVAIYMPLIAESVVAILACARIGAVHMVVFGGFSAEALRERIVDSDACLLITADGGFRKGGIIALKQAADSAVEECPTIKHTIVVRHTNQPVNMKEGRDYWYEDLMQNAALECSAQEMDAEDLLFILYTSGTTGKPKGILHTTGGYMVGAATTTKWVFDIQPDDIYWCTADIGWITGHSYVVYGPLANGATVFLYEGVFDWPQRNRFFTMIEKHRISILYTAPTLIRTFMKWGEEWPNSSNLSSLRLLGSVGEPINPEAWMWYYNHIGKQNCPIVDTWWQTETGSILIAPIPGQTPLKPGSATFSLPGIDVAILDENGNPSKNGYLAITSPWPSMLRGIHKDPKRYEETYWKKWDGRFYFSGDGAKHDEEGYYWLLGRVDDVLSVSGHRIGSAELENAFIDYSSVAESAVVAISHPIKGEAIAAFVVLKEGTEINETLVQTLKQHIVNKIGAFARPEKIIFVRDLPKTRSGKIMRRLLRDIAENRGLGDTTTLADPNVINELKSLYEED